MHPSLIYENCSSHSKFILPGVSHQVSAQEDIWFGRWCLKNSKMAVQCWTLFAILIQWFQIFCVTYLPHIKFLLKRIYGLEDDDVWIIPGWLFSVRQSLLCKWDDFSYFWVSMLPEASYQVFAQEDIWLWRR